MGVITVSRQYGAAGEEIAEKVSKIVGYRIIGRKEIEKKLTEIAGEGFPKRVIEEKAPGIIERMTADLRIWKNLLRESILSFAIDEEVLFMGRGSFAVFKDVPGVLNILVTGTFEERVRYLSVKGGTSAVHAEETIERIDRERAGFLKYYFGVDWPDPALFHFSVNPLSMGIDESAMAIEALSSILGNRDDFETERGKIIQEKYIATASENRIILSAGIDIDLFSLSVKDGNNIEVRFFNVPDELREKAIKATGEFTENYTISQVG